MESNLSSAIIQFLADEFRLEPDSVTADLSFTTDLNLTPQQVEDLLDRIQDALDFVIPEDKSSSIATVGDLLIAITPEPDHEPL